MTTTPECKIESYYTTGKQRKIDCFSVDGFCIRCCEAMGCYFHFCPCQEAKASLSEEETQRGIRKREHDELRKDYLKLKNIRLLKSGSVNGGKVLKKKKMLENT